MSPTTPRTPPQTQPNLNTDPTYYPHHSPITTRWSDNDQYGHLNNSIYYHLFDGLINAYLITKCGLNPQSTGLDPEDLGGENVGKGGSGGGGPIGLVVESGCRYWSPLEFPTPLVGLLSVKKMGTSSVTYHVAIASRTTTSPQSVSKDRDARDGAEGNGKEGLVVAASGFLTHVFVDPVSRRPTKVTKKCRDALMAIAASDVVVQTRAPSKL